MVRMLARENLLLIRFDGLPMYVRPTIDTLTYLVLPFEPFTRTLFKRALKHGATVLDIGAHYGYYSVIAAKRVGREGRVYAFEPAPTNFDILTRNIKLNEYTDVIEAVKKAVVEKRGKAMLSLSRHFDSTHHLHHSAGISKHVSVECITIDEFLRGQHVDVIKMDIEGSEPYALEGMKRTVRRCDNLILFTEFAPDFLRRAGVEPLDYIHQLESMGFNVRLIDEVSFCLKPAKNSSLSKMSWYANLYCTKN